MPYGSIVEGKMIAALRAVGGDYVFDTDFGADMTIMEEASELKYRLHSQKKLLPQFTSCCPSWVEFAEIYFPELIPHLSTARSPISMLSPIIKTYLQTAEYRSGQYHQCLCDTVYIKESRNTPPRNEQCWSVYGQT